jgi:hypothetical protein
MPNRRRRENGEFVELKRSWKKVSVGLVAGQGARIASASAGSCRSVASSITPFTVEA